MHMRPCLSLAERGRSLFTACAYASSSSVATWLRRLATVRSST